MESKLGSALRSTKGATVKETVAFSRFRSVFLNRSGLVSTLIAPPAAETRCRPVAGDAPARMTVSSDAHVAPREEPSICATVTAGPPVAATFFRIEVLSTKPTHVLSGDTNTPEAHCQFATQRTFPVRPQRPPINDVRNIDMDPRVPETTMCGRASADVTQFPTRMMVTGGSP